MFTQELLDPQDLLDQFWSDRYRHPEKQGNREDVENLLRRFRKVLDSSSKTAVAIDRDDPLNEIVRCAEKEGFMEVAQLLSI
ncbi:MAG: hypothetical protein NPINA01_25280 [Nitrospinaceae bacterium]|nr:MAG: hypothetical protein NPINA01_25280 [Nitrospinaceae bacterium]